MTTDVLNYKSPIGRIVIRDRIRSASLILILIALVTLSAFVFAKYIALSNSIEKGEFLTQEQLINGGKRFIDYFWSLNSRSVEFDQYTAARMFVNQEDYHNRVDYLVKSDFIGRVVRAKIVSEIDWENSEYTVLEAAPTQPSNSIRIEYKGRLTVNRQTSVPWHMILVLTPTEFTNDNPTGVGILSYTDIAEVPIL